MVYFWLALGYGFALLPLRVGRGVAVAIAWLVWPWRKKRRRIIAANLRILMGQLSAEERKRLARQSYYGMFLAIFENLWIWFGRPRRLAKCIVEVEGKKLVEEALQQKQGAILLTPHIGPWELMGRYASEHYKTTILYQPISKNSVMEEHIKGKRSLLGGAMVATDISGLRTLVKTLRNKGSVGLLPDRRPNKESGAFADFLGQPVLTMDLVYRLLKHNRVPVFFGMARRLPKGKFHITFFPAPEGVYDASREESLKGLNLGVQQCIELAPEQYSWDYNRLRYRPEGYESVR